MSITNENARKSGSPPLVAFRSSFTKAYGADVKLLGFSATRTALALASQKAMIFYVG